MSRRRNVDVPPSLDAEVVELLQDDPQLLAIADAVAATQRRRRRKPFVASSVAATVAAVAAVALIFSLSDRSSLVDDALAAVGSERVVHSIIVRDIDAEQIVNLRTGATRPTRVRIEAWSDHASGRLRVRTSRNGRVVADALTAASSPIADPGALDATARFFVTGYRSALESGRAREASGASDALVIEEPIRARVILGQDKRPVRLTAISPRAGTTTSAWRVVNVRSEALGPATFDVPTRENHPTGGRVVQRHRIAVAGAARALDGATVWAGPVVDQLPLQRIESQVLERQLANGGKARRSGVQITYRSTEGRLVQLRQALRPDPAYGYVEGRYTFAFGPIPAAGEAAITAPSATDFGGGWRAQLRVNDVFVTVRASDRELLLTAIQALRPIT
jgi:hypothetical protein